MGSANAATKRRLLDSYEKRHRLIGFAFAIPAVIFLLVFVLYRSCTTSG